ncbi:MAG: hypothetical protein K0R03_1367 [Moraxellaceae bacterium]|jgi:hypothetical protein|nr:hypothetical protein [Moraxellaceae bacterium]
MAGKEQKRKQLHYRRASFLQPTGRTLQDLVEEAVNRLTPVSARIERLNDDAEGWQRFINTHRSVMGMEFGNLVLYAPDQNRQIIAMDDDADELDIEHIAPPEMKDGKKRQFLESLLYYGLKDNHVILLQSMALRARDIELYLNWLLRTVGIFDENNAVFLNNYAPQVTQEKLERAEVKSVKIGTPLVDMSAEMAPEAPTQGGMSSRSVRFRPWGEGLDILRAVMPERMKDLSWEDLQSSSNLEVFVEVTYKRQTDESSQQLLNKLTTALRHVGDEDIRIELKGGGSIVGSELQIKNFRQITSYDGILDPSSVFMEMNAWLMEILERGLIDAG